MFHFLRRGASLLKKKQEDILSGAFVIAVSVSLSMILGLVKWRLLAVFFGQKIAQLDSFIVASKLIDSVFEVIIFGSIAVSFIPVFSKYLSKEKIAKSWDFAATMITLGCLAFFVLSLAIFVFAPQIAPIIGPGLVEKEPLTRPIITRLLRIMSISQIFFVASIFITAILQSFQRFVLPALASVFYNLGIIISIIFLAPVLGIYAPAVGMIIGALLHLLIQLPLAYSLGFRFKFKLKLKDESVIQTLSLMAPRSLALAVIRVSDLISLALASTAAIGSVSAFNFALILQTVPINVFAGSIAQAALPALSLKSSIESRIQFKKVFTEAFHQILFLVLPVAAILAILRIPVVRLAFGAKELEWDTTVLAGRVLIAFAFGIAAQSTSLLLTRAFYAVHDSETPVKVNITSILLNIALAIYFILVRHFSLIWLAAAYSAGSITNALLLLYFLDRKIQLNRREFLLPIFKMAVITILTAVSLYIPMKTLDQLVFNTSRTFGLLMLTTIATAVGLSVYAFLSWLLNVEQFFIFVAFTKRLFTWGRRIFKTPLPPAKVESL